MSSAMDADDSHDRVLLSHVRPADWVSPTPRPCYDLVVIGGGTARLVAARGTANQVRAYPTYTGAIGRAADAYNRTRLTPRVARLLRGWLAWRRPARGV